MSLSMELWPRVLFLPVNKPPDRGYKENTDKNDRVPVHQTDVGRHRHAVWEAEHDVEENDEHHGDEVDRISVFAQPERTRCDVLAASQEMWKDGK